jgi:hypothetical protein
MGKATAENGGLSLYDGQSLASLKNAHCISRFGTCLPRPGQNLIGILALDGRNSVRIALFLYESCRELVRRWLPIFVQSICRLCTH